MTAEQFVDFLNKSQRDPRLNEILYPYANVVRAKDLISQHEPSKSNAQRGRIAWKNCCMLFNVNSACLGAEVACIKKELQATTARWSTSLRLIFPQNLNSVNRFYFESGIIQILT